MIAYFNTKWYRKYSQSEYWKAIIYVDCEQSLFCSKIRRENEHDGMRDIRAASGEAASRE